MDQEISSCSRLITQHFQLEENELSTATSISDLKLFLAGIIKRLLDQDLNRLLNAFYKIDISEGRFRKILSASSPESMPTELADLVIERELMKVKTRAQYRNSFTQKNS